MLLEYLVAKEKRVINQQRLPGNAVLSAVVPGLRVQTALRAGATPSDDLLEATRHFLQSLLNALPATGSNPSTASNNAATTTPATS